MALTMVLLLDKWVENEAQQS